MKTKNKTIAMVEIAVVLFSVFLVALPVTAIAAEQALQKVSASEVTTASEDDFVLDIYGNANEDDTIDMRDLTYVKLIFFGKKPETELADAKYDGKINPLDFIQIKLIIVGKEKELTLIDSADRIVTVKKPVERVVLTYPYHGEAIRVLRAQDKVVGVSHSIAIDEVYFPDFNKLPDVGSAHPPDYEVILSLNPDLLITSYASKAEECAEKLPSVSVVGFHLYKPATLMEELVKLSYILDKKAEAKHYIDDFHVKYTDLIKTQTEELSEEERQKVYMESYTEDYKTYGFTSAAQQMIDITGGRNIFADIPKWSATVDPEDVIVRNPDIIIKQIGKADAGYEYNADDTSKIKALWESIMNRDELAKVAAVKARRVYIIDSEFLYGLDYPVAIAYLAKWTQPDLFIDLDPQAIHQEFLEFQGFDYDLDKHGVFVYPPLED